MKHRLALATLSFAFIASAGQADVPPLPSAAAGLSFIAWSHYTAPGHRVNGPLTLVNCQKDAPNCKAATAAKVVGADVVSVNGKEGADPLKALAAKPPSPVVIVFKRRNGDGTTQLVTVTFTSE